MGCFDWMTWWDVEVKRQSKMSGMGGEEARYLEEKEMLDSELRPKGM